jgi:hypothetical protein
MDAKQTNRIFWVGATAAALWLTYRALKKSATVTTIAVSNTPTSTVEKAPSNAPATQIPIVDIGQSQVQEPVNESIVVTNPGSTDSGWGFGSPNGYNPDDSYSFAEHMTDDQIAWVNGVNYEGNPDASPLYVAYSVYKSNYTKQTGKQDYWNDPTVAEALAEIRARLFTYQYPTS